MSAEEGSTPISTQNQSAPLNISNPPPQQSQQQQNRPPSQNQNSNQQNHPPRNQNQNRNKNNNRGGNGNRPQDQSNNESGAPNEAGSKKPPRQHGGKPQHQQGGGQQQDGGRQNQGARRQNQDGGRPQHQEGGEQNHDGGRQQQHNARPPRRGGGQQQYHRYNPRHNQRSTPASGFDHLIKSRKDHAGVTMTGNVHDCLICCQPSDVFGVGECRHPVCMECCIRMRILGNSESCPQCRSPITLLYFVSAPESWDNFTIPTGDITHNDSAKYNIRFTSDYTVQCYDSYLAHSCQICAQNGDKIEFATFGALRHHTAQTHQHQFCPICIEHLNILSKDRKTYLKNELDNHMKGTSNEVSGQKGHPSCMFCPERFFDDDHLYRHLRKEHFFCQICENEGGHNIFYPKVEELYKHYRLKHHPCTHPDCLAMGIAFRTDVELGVHRASEHGGSGNRTVNIDFEFNGRNQGNRILRTGAQNERDYPVPSIRQERISVVPSDAPPPSNLPSRIVPSAQNQQAHIVPSRFVASNSHDFPILNPSAPTSSSTNTMPNWRQEVQAIRRPQPPSQAPLQLTSGEQFPTLPGEAGSSNGNKSKNNKPAANSVWGKGKPIQLFTANNPPPPKPKTDEQPRRKFIPLPDIWPEGMRERVEAKIRGEKDPGPQEPEELDPLFRVEASAANAKKEKRQAAKKKSKTVPVSAFANREVQDNIVQPSKFDALAEMDEPKSSKKNKVNKINYTLTSDNTVKIEPAPTLRSVADSIGEKKSKSPTENVKSKENGTKVPPPSSSTNEISDFPALGSSSGSLLPSLTDIASGFTSIWKSRTNPSTTNPPPSSSSSASTSKPPTSSWSTGPPPGFS
jgi:hypothetical protein